MTRLVLRRVHLVVSLAAGLWLAVSGLTGSLLVFGDALDRALHPELFVVRAAGRVPLDAIVSDRVVRMRLAGSQTPVHELWLDCDDCLRAYVDPSTGQVNGIRTAHGTTRTFLHELHRRMLLRGAGDFGALVGGVALLVLAITGITLGWRGGFRMRHANQYELHRVAGLLASPFLMIAAATGIYFIAASLGAPPADRPAGSRRAIEHALRSAQREFATAEPTWISFANDEIVVRFRQSFEAHPNGRTFVRMRDGKVVAKTDARIAATKQKFLDNLYPLHIGATGGRLHRVVLVVAGTTPAVLMTTGVVLWLRRSRRRRATRTAGFQPAATPPSRRHAGRMPA